MYARTCGHHSPTRSSNTGARLYAAPPSPVAVVACASAENVLRRRRPPPGSPAASHVLRGSTSHMRPYVNMANLSE
jgi:hypothetical protein